MQNATESGHLDRFALERLPPADQQPEFLFTLPELGYPQRLNCAVTLIDEAIAEGHGDRTAIIDDTGTWTYRQLSDWTNRIAGVLTARFGLVPGNRVLLRGTNSRMLAACWLATIKAGGIAVTTMPMLRATELTAIIEKGSIQFALCEHALLDDLEKARAETTSIGEVATWGDGDLEAKAQLESGHFSAADTHRDDVCLLAFTSGTTGAPKATMHFHRDVLAMADVVGRHLLHTSPADRYTGSPPLGFTFGLGALLVFPLRFRASTIMVGAPKPARLLDAVQDHGATCIFTAPTMYRTLAGLVDDYDLASLVRCVSAGEPLPVATFDLWRDKTGIALIDGIGATEMIHIFISAAGEQIRPGATGKPLPGYIACVLDDDNRPLPPGSSGRLAVKGPTGCRYLDDERQRIYAVAGWNVTGDRYHLDEDGYFWFEARADDMIVSSGYNISGPEVEAALLRHEAVIECAVVGVPDDERGNIVKAFVVACSQRRNDPTLARELQDFVKHSIAPYKYPRAVQFVDSLPKTPSGKIQRFRLRASTFRADTL